MSPPIKPTIATRRRDGLRPYLSAKGLHTSAPATAPACMVVTRLPEMSATALDDLVSKPNSRLKSGMTSTPPIIPASTPKRAPAKHAFFSLAN